jgi:predicted alpha-1,6-mannanase (GH76 family)
MALTSMGQLDHQFFDARLGLYVVTPDKYGPSAALWPTAQILQGAITLARMTRAPRDIARVRRIIGSLRQYMGQASVYHTRAVPSRRYTDDNNWIGLDLLDAYDLLHDPGYLEEAVRIFNFAVSFWDPVNGGIVWGEGQTQRPTVSNAPVITIGLRLAALTGQQQYRAWADRIDGWENAHLRASNGLYWDHVNANESVDTSLYTYNQGVMIDANLEYAVLTGQRQYLDVAQQIANATAAAFAGHWYNHDDAAMFDAIFFEAVARLDRARPGAASLEPLRHYLAWAWPVASAPRSAHDEHTLLDQAAYVLDASTLAAAA